MDKISARKLLQDIATLLRFQRSIGIDDYPQSAPLKAFLAPGPLVLPAVEAAAVAGDPNAGRQTTTLDALETAWRDCQRCRLHTHRHRIVFGEGASRAPLFIVGDWPSQTDDRQGKPFSDEAGDLLTRMLAAIGLQRSEVFITNLLKCYPGDRQPPGPDETRTCLPFLYHQIDIISPLIICAMGQHAAQTLLNSSESLFRLRGRFHDFKQISQTAGDSRKAIKLIPTLHPAFLLKNPEMKKASWEDLQLIQRTLQKEQLRP